MRKEPVSVTRTLHHLIHCCCCFVSLFKIRKNTMIAYELCKNSANAVKPKTSTRMFILSRIHVALEQLSISFTSTKFELSALTLVGRFGTCFGLFTYFSLLWQCPKTWASYIYSACLAVIYISLKHLLWKAMKKKGARFCTFLPCDWIWNLTNCNGNYMLCKSLFQQPWVHLHLWGPSRVLDHL